MPVLSRSRVSRFLPLLLLFCAIFLAHGAQGAERPFSLAVNGDGAERKLVLSEKGAAIASFPLPKRIEAKSIGAGLEKPLWHPSGTAVAAAFLNAEGTVLVIFLQKGDEKWIAADVSGMELANLSRLGIGGRKPYMRIETTLAGWLHRSQDDSVQLQTQTRAWDHKGQRYTTGGHRIVTREGTVFSQ